MNYIEIKAESNVTGVLNPVHEVARMAHEVGALVVVNTSTASAHCPINMLGDEEAEAVDVLCLSGHKIYTPGSPGVIIARRDLFSGREPEEVGGGVVSFVDTARYHISPTLPDREETGTPNLPGSLALAATLQMLSRIGMDVIEEDEQRLTQYALDRLARIDGIHIYGSHRLELAERIGVVASIIAGMPQVLVPAVQHD